MCIKKRLVKDKDPLWRGTVFLLALKGQKLTSPQSMSYTVLLKQAIFGPKRKNKFEKHIFGTKEASFGIFFKVDPKLTFLGGQIDSVDFLGGPKHFLELVNGQLTTWRGLHHDSLKLPKKLHP